MTKRIFSFFLFSCCCACPNGAILEYQGRTQHTTHNTQHTTNNTQHTTHNTPHIYLLYIYIITILIFFFPHKSTNSALSALARACVSAFKSRVISPAQQSAPLAPHTSHARVRFEPALRMRRRGCRPHAPSTQPPATTTAAAAAATAYADLCAALQQTLDAVHVLRGGSGRVITFVPRTRFAALYPASAVARTGVPAWERFAPPPPLAPLVAALSTEEPATPC